MNWVSLFFSLGTVLDLQPLPCSFSCRCLLRVVPLLTIPRLCWCACVLNPPIVLSALCVLAPRWADFARGEEGTSKPSWCSTARLCLPKCSWQELRERPFMCFKPFCSNFFQSGDAIAYTENSSSFSSSAVQAELVICEECLCRNYWITVSNAVFRFSQTERRL